MTWLTSNYGVIAMVLLTIAEVLQVLFPSKDGFGGYLGSAIRFFKSLGVKDVSGQ